MEIFSFRDFHRRMCAFWTRGDYHSAVALVPSGSHSTSAVDSQLRGPGRDIGAATLLSPSAWTRTTPMCAEFLLFSSYLRSSTRMMPSDPRAYIHDAIGPAERCCFGFHAAPVLCTSCCPAMPDIYRRCQSSCCCTHAAAGPWFSGWLGSA